MQYIKCIKVADAFPCQGERRKAAVWTCVPWNYICIIGSECSFPELNSKIFIWALWTIMPSEHKFMLLWCSIFLLLVISIGWTICNKSLFNNFIFSSISLGYWWEASNDSPSCTLFCVVMGQNPNGGGGQTASSGLLQIHFGLDPEHPTFANTAHS